MLATRPRRDRNAQGQSLASSTSTRVIFAPPVMSSSTPWVPAMDTVYVGRGPSGSIANEDNLETKKAFFTISLSVHQPVSKGDEEL